VSKSQAVLGVNAFISSVYGAGCLLDPSKILAIYGSTEKIVFLHPAHGMSQYLGGLHLTIALRCLSALGVGCLPKRDAKLVLQEQAVVHAAMAAVAGYRTIAGAQISLLAATASPLPGSILLAALSYAAAKSL